MNGHVEALLTSRLDKVIIIFFYERSKLRKEKTVNLTIGSISFNFRNVLELTEFVRFCNW